MNNQSSTEFLPLAAEQYVLVGVTNRLEEILITNILRNAGYITHVVDTCAMAQHALVNHPFHFVILDCSMADLQKNGFNTLVPHLLKTQGNPKIIALLTEPNPTLSKNLEKIGFHHIIQAPITEEKLIKSFQSVDKKPTISPRA